MNYQLRTKFNSLMLLMLVWTAGLFFGFSKAQAAEYYVDATEGSDSNTGLSHAQAWQTLAKVNSTITGTSDKVYLLCGETWAGDVSIVVDWSGTAQENAILGAYYMVDTTETPCDASGCGGNSKPIIDGQNTYPIADWGGQVRTYNATYVTIQDLNIIRTNGNGIYFNSGSSYCTATRNVVHDTFRTNIKFQESDYGTATFNILSRGATRRLIYPTGWPNGGIGLGQTTGGVAMYNTINTSFGEGFTTGYNSTIKYNTIIDTMAPGIYLDGAHSSEVAYNEIYGTDETIYEDPDTPGYHGHGIGIAIETGAYIVTDNYDNIIHHNVVKNTRTGVKVFCEHETYTIHDIEIYNNTFLENQYTFAVSNVSDRVDNNFYIYNNLSHDPLAAHAIAWNESLDDWTVDYNSWHIDTAPAGIWSGGNDVTADPVFVSSSDYHLQSTSPNRDAGYNAAWSGTAGITDMDGIGITDGGGTIVAPGGTVDIGAYEYSSLRADVDQSGSSNTTDAQLTLRYSLALDMSQTAWYNSATTGDADCSGTTNSTDAMLILRNSLGLDMSATAWCVD